MRKKISTLFLAVMLILNLNVFVGYAEDEISVTLNGQEIAFDVPPQLIDNRTMVPLRKIFEAMGAEVEWDNYTKTVTAVKGDERVIATVDNKNVYISGETKVLDVPPMIVDDRTLVPVRFVAESFGANVNWDEPTRTVIIMTEWDGVGEVPCYSKFPMIPDMGAILGVYGFEYNSDSSGAVYRYAIQDMPSSLLPYVYLMEDYGFDVRAGYSDDILYVCSKDGIYVDIVLWDEYIDVGITIPDTQISTDDSQASNIESGTENSIYESFTNGYTLAEFSQYNSPASENGLGNTPIYINCVITGTEILDTEQGQMILGYLTDDSGNNWLAMLNITLFDNESTYNNIIGKDLIFCGLYSGYSSVKNMPTIELTQLYVKDSGEIITGIGMFL